MCTGPVTPSTGPVHTFSEHRRQSPTGEREGPLQPTVKLGDRQYLIARAVAETHRRMARPVLARIPDTRSNGRRPRLVSAIPSIDGNYRSTI
jgi:hypothetical protein